MNRSQDGKARFQEVRRFFRWLKPGLGVKRWFFLALGGMALLAVGSAIFLLDLYRGEYTNQAFLAFLHMYHYGFCHAGRG